MPAAVPTGSPTDAAVALELQLLRGQLQASGLRPALKASAERRLALAIAHLSGRVPTPAAEGGPVREGGDSGTRRADPAPGPPPASSGPEAATSGPERPHAPEEIGPAAHDAEGARLPHWVGT